MTFDATVDAIFRAALALGDAQREAFLQARCVGNLQLENQVRVLLEMAAVPEQALSARFAALRDALWRSRLEADNAPDEDLSGQRIGAWNLERLLGRGGLASVYLAKRADGNYVQTAAFKVLRRGLDTDDLIARFRSERQILSTLDHPSIARILDGGALIDGRPYLVLEYIDGVAITTWCDDHRIDIEGRLRLVITVLDALHHAHSHLIVHRDIKPSNILVSRKGEVVLLDFGIAKLLDPDALPGTSAHTRTGLSLLTPGYGSPEQQAGQPVTTASDIYQAGQVTYELLTGRRPFEDAGRCARDEPVAPSRRLRGRPDFYAVRGDLDAIVARAMHVDPGRRYASTAEMREDLQRHLARLPIRARPDTWRYRFGKLIRRRPWLMPLVGVALVILAAYLATIIFYTRQLQIEEQRASAAQTFLADLLGSPDPYAPTDADHAAGITMVEALDLGVARLRGGAYDDDPKLRVALLAAIAGVYRGVDQHRKSIALLEEVISQQRHLYGARSEPVLASLATLANQHKTLGDYAAAAGYYDEQLAVARQMYAPDHPGLGVAEALSADFRISNGDLDAAKALLRRAIPRMRNAPRAYARPLIDALVDLAAMVGGQTSDEAMALLAEARILAESAYGADSLMAALVYSQMAIARADRGEFDRALAIFDKSAAIHAALVGPDHGETLAARDRLGSVYRKMGAYDRAEAVHRDVLGRYLARYGAGHRGVAISYQHLAAAVAGQGRDSEAIALHQRALDSYRALLGDTHPLLAGPLLSIAAARARLGDLAAAEDTARQALAQAGKSSSGTRLAAAARCVLATLDGPAAPAAATAALTLDTGPCFDLRVPGLRLD